MQNKLIDYIGSLNPERREGSHINYINENMILIKMKSILLL